MNVKMLDMKNHIDASTGCLCRYVRSDTEYFRPHYHNYYEIFMVLKGNVCHIINGKEQNLSIGQMLFIRDFDVHDYKSADGNYFEFINLAFDKSLFQAMMQYLEGKFPIDDLMKAPYPPSVILSDGEKEKLFFSFTELGGGDVEMIKLKVKTLLLNVFMKYFYNYSERKTDIPLWLEMTYEKMKKPENFIGGTEKMYKICPKSREHLCRSLKKFYNITPCQLVNDLRLEYCVNLLITSNLSATDICFECGFENLSWFYKVFSKRYGMTPNEYRKKHDIR